METKSTDVLIIGSGFGGAVPALRFAKAGFKTALLEKGPDIHPYQSFKQTQDPKYLLKYYKNLSSMRLNLQYIEALGGGSGFYEMMSLRAPSLAFSMKNKNGVNEWPTSISRQNMDPYYERAERMIGVEQIQDKDIPKTGHVFSMLMKKCNYSVEKARYALKNCQNSGHCISGCIYGAKQSLFMNYLPKAKEQGASIETEMEAFAIKPIKYFNKNNNLNLPPYRYWVICKNRKHSDDIVYYKTRILILSAGTIGTAKLLLSSKENLPNLSNEVGRNITFNGSVKAIAKLPDDCPDADMYSGRSHPGLVSYHFLESEKIMVTAAKVLPVQLVSGARLDTSELGFPFWGKEYTDLLRKFRHRMIILAALGVEPVKASMSVNDIGKVNLYLNANKELRGHYDRILHILNAIFQKTGCEPVPFYFVSRNGRKCHVPFFTSSHQLGSCRMSDNIRRGVVDAFSEVFQYPGMYITDGSVIPASTIVNPSLTILANAERVTDHILKKYRKQVYKAS